MGNKRKNKVEKKKVVATELKHHKLDKPLTYTVLLLIVLLGTMAIYSKAIDYPFLNWDDNVYVTDSELIQDSTSYRIQEIFTTGHNSNYHPLTTLSYAILYRQFGPNPTPFHLFNIILHLLNTLLVYFVISTLARNKAAGLITAALFALHPMHVESVAWISETKDVLYTFFLLISMMLYLVWLNKKKVLPYLGAVFFFILSLLSKSAAVIFPVLLLLTDLYFKRKDYKAMLLEKLPFLVAAFVIGLVAISTQQADSSINMVNGFGFIDRIFIASYGLSAYFIKFIFPLKLAALHYYPKNNELSPLFYISIIPVIFFFAWIYRKVKSKDGIIGFDKEIAYGILFFITALLLVLQFVPVGRAVIAERYTYLPYIGLGFIAGQYLHYAKNGLFKKKPIINTSLAIGILVIGTIIFSSITYMRIDKWSSTDVLFTDIIEKYPDHGYAYVARGNSRLNSMGMDAALKDYDQAVKIEPDMADAWHRRGVVRISKQDYEGGIPDINMAINLDPDAPAPWNDRGSLKFKSGYFKESVVDFEMAISLKDDYSTAYKNCGIAYYQLDQKEKAMEYIRKAIEIDNEYADAYYERGNIYLREGDKTKACSDWQNAFKYGFPQAEDKLKKHCN